MSDDPAVLPAADEKAIAVPATLSTAPLPSDALIIVPVRNIVLFPGTVIPIVIQRSHSIEAAQKALRQESQIGVLMQRDPDLAEPTADDLYRTGTVANILRYITLPDGSHHVVLQGEQRFSVVDFIQDRPFLAARVLRIEEPESGGPEIEARTLHLRGLAVEAIELLPNAPREIDPGHRSRVGGRARRSRRRLSRYRRGGAAGNSRDHRHREPDEQGRALSGAATGSAAHQP
ncbi:hypothetical protein GGD83_004356 [Rhodoblastus sphagnicola]|nr:hypothetical protein [Rhodoblastus sphagnicola]